MIRLGFDPIRQRQVPGGDHAPYYYAKKLGWYAKEGIDLKSIEWTAH